MNNFRVFLRELTESDVNKNYLDGFSNPDVHAYLEVDGSSLTVDKVVDYINMGKESNSFHMYAVCLSDTNEHIGNLKIGPIDQAHQTADLVTVIWNRAQWGKGLATEAIKLGNKLAFNEHNIRKLSGGMYANNTGSIKAYTRAGWVVEARLQNHYLHDNKPVDRVIVSCFNPCHS